MFSVEENTLPCLLIGACLLRLNHDEWHENTAILFLKPRYIFTLGKKKKKPITHILFSKQYKWERTVYSSAPGMIFKKMQNIQKHGCTQAAKRHAVFCTEFRVLAAASMRALRAAVTMTAAPHPYCGLYEWQGKAMSIMKNRGPYD